ncbi:MAG: type II CAAX endopeptidase family protein [Bacteroidota bacterium]
MGSIISIALWAANGISIDMVQSDVALSYAQRMYLRLGLIINHASMFLIPGLLLGFFFHRGKFRQFIGADLIGYTKQYLFWGLAIIVAYPLIGGLTQWTMSLPLPDWLVSSQDQSMAMLSNTLVMDTPIELISNLLLVGVMAAVGEELIFRGILQKKLSHQWSNPHLAVIISSVVFAGIHMQAERFPALFVLGVLLGYSFHYTRSIWVPIILHLLNNSIQVLAVYASPEEVLDLSEVPSIQWYEAVISLCLTLGLAYAASLMPSRVDELRP